MKHAAFNCANVGFDSPWAYLMSQSVFIANMVIHVSAYQEYKRLYQRVGYTRLRKQLKQRGYTKSQQSAVISKIHNDL